MLPLIRFAFAFKKLNAVLVDSFASRSVPIPVRSNFPFPGSIWDENTFLAGYDSDWNACPLSEAVYRMSADISEEEAPSPEGILLCGTIAVSYSDGKEIYTLTTQCYRTDLRKEGL